jgi:hypothetical protein
VKVTPRRALNRTSARVPRMRVLHDSIVLWLLTVCLESIKHVEPEIDFAVRHFLRGHSNPANEGHLKTGQR